MTYAKLVSSYKMSQFGLVYESHLINDQEWYTLVGWLQNVLHWHIVDTQSFPLEIPSYPKLWNGAYSSSQRYTFEDAAEIVKYICLDPNIHANKW